MYDTPYTPTGIDTLRQQEILTKVYAWMMAGLLLTGAIASFVANTPPLVEAILLNPFLFFGLIIAQLVLVIGLSAAIGKLSPVVATGIFLAYSALNGLTMSSIFLMYTPVSIGMTFMVTGGMFGATSVYGYVTKRDLSGMGSFLFMGLIGFLLASVVNIFLQNEMLYWIVTYAGIALFIGLTVYDTQKIKEMAANAQTEQDAGRVAIIGALHLYLDFINLFLLLLRIFGNRR
ncbi:MAG: Bax inhibitor-1/YccA family protein [Chloroflexaceae bacterium]|nr:Bax inhibitor-1/YccA family protein [Chloroflexaceae bacterium]